MKLVSAIAALGLSGCSIISGISHSCDENETDGSRMCITIDTSQNITTRSIERDHKLYISTCSNGNCTEYREVGAAAAK